ncbi:MAG: acyltransferase [Pseudaminobacter sp.]
MSSKEHLYGLDLLRIMAAVLVLLNHFALFGWETPNGSAQGSAAAFAFLEPFAVVGAIGVEIFFVISGFVIALSTLSATPSQFLRHRIIRVFPALWICGLISLVARAAGGEEMTVLFMDYARSAVLSPIGPYIDGVVWTLVVEAVFYGVIFFAMIFNKLITLEGIALILGISSSIFITVFLYFHAANMMYGGSEVYDLLKRFPFKVLLLRHGVFFAIGILIYSIFQQGFAREKAAYIAAFCVFGLIEIAISYGAAEKVVPMLLIWLCSLVVVIASVRFARVIQEFFHTNHNSVRNLGRLSYPLYLSHYSFGMVLVPLLASQGLGRMNVLAISLFMVFATSWMVMYWPEAMMQRYLRTVFFRAKRNPVEVYSR